MRNFAPTPALPRYAEEGAEATGIPQRPPDCVMPAALRRNASSADAIDEA